MGRRLQNHGRTPSRKVGLLFVLSMAHITRTCGLVLPSSTNAHHVLNSKSIIKSQTRQTNTQNSLNHRRDLLIMASAASSFVSYRFLTHVEYNVCTISSFHLVTCKLNQRKASIEFGSASGSTYSFSN